MKKIFVFVLSICCMGMVCGCACDSEFDFQLDTSKEVTLTVVGPLSNFEALEAVAAKWEDIYPNCHIVYEKIDDYNDNIVKRLDNQDQSTHMFLSDRSLLVAVPDLQNYALNYYDELNGISLADTKALVTSSQAIDEKLYTVPLALNARGLAINKTLLSKENVSVPKKYSEFIAACESLKNKGYIPIQANNAYIGLGMFYSYFAASIVNGNSYETTMNDLNTYKEGSGDYLTDVFTKMIDIMNRGYIDINQSKGWADNYETAILNFFEGDVPFFPCTAETVSGMEKRETMSETFIANPFEYEFICMPVGDDGEYCYWSTWQGIVINKNAENENWSRAFVNFLLKKDNLQTLAKVKGMPSNTEDFEVDQKFSSLYTVPESRVAEANDFQITCYSQINTVLQRIVSPYTASRRDANGNYVLDDADKKITDSFDPIRSLDAAKAMYETEIAKKR